MSKSKIAKINNFLSLNSDMNEFVAAEFNKGVKFALKADSELNEASNIAQKLVNIYDTQAHLEFLRFEEDYFDPLFARLEIKETLLRLSGYKRSILIVDSLKRTSLNGKKRSSAKSNLRYNSYINFIEDYANLYQNHIENLEILYL